MIAVQVPENTVLQQQGNAGVSTTKPAGGKSKKSKKNRK
jgi:hypothetical protein